MTILNLDIKLFKEDQLNDFKSKGINLIYSDTIENVAEQADIEMIIGGFSLSRLKLENFKKLKVIQLLSAGFDYLPADVLANKDIIILNAKDIYSIPIAEWVLAQILSVYKKNSFFYENQKTKSWKKNFDLVELNGKNICIFGTGSIGQEIAKRLKAFGCQVSGVNSNGRAVTGFDNYYDMKSILVDVSNFDIIIFALPSNEKTRQYVDKSFLNKLNSSALVINVGRGDLVVEEDLVQYLINNLNSLFILDVFEVEPLDLKSKLWELENLIVSPHNSFASSRNDQRLQDLVTKNIEAFTSKGTFINVIKV